MASKKVMIYGAYGYSGRLIVNQMLTDEMSADLTLSGRDELKLRKFANRINLPFQAFDLSSSEHLESVLQSFDFIVNAAGPFSSTAQPLVDACLKSNCHYLDITGELEVFESLQRRDKEIRKGNILVMPGVGFDVVPSDCLAVALKKRLPSATHLEMAFRPEGGASVGTIKTVIENLGKGTAVRKNGRIVYEKVPATKSDFDSKEFRHGVAVSWGDVSTAFHSTAIPNITVYLASSRLQGLLSKSIVPLQFLFNRPRFIRIAKKVVSSLVSGPSESTRDNTRSYFWGQVLDQEGQKVCFEFSTPNGYDLTAKSTVLVLKKLLNAKEITPGFQTPGAYLGSELIQQIDGVDWNDQDFTSTK